MANVSFMSLDGKKELEKALKDTGIDVQKGVMQTMDKTGLELRNKLRDTIIRGAPASAGSVPSAQSGLLKRSIKYALRKLELGRPISMAIFTKKNAFYAHMLEFGTSNLEARPFFFSGLAKAEPKLAGYLKNKLEWIIQDRQKRLHNISQKKRGWSDAQKQARIDADQSKLNAFVREFMK